MTRKNDVFPVFRSSLGFGMNMVISERPFLIREKFTAEHTMSSVSDINIIPRESRFDKTRIETKSVIILQNDKIGLRNPDIGT